MKRFVFLCTLLPLVISAASAADDTPTIPVKVSFVQLADGLALQIQGLSTAWPNDLFLDCHTASYQLWKSLAAKDYATGSVIAAEASPFSREPNPKRNECMAPDPNGKGFQMVDLPLASDAFNRLKDGFVVDIKANYKGHQIEQRVSVSISKAITLLNGNPKMLTVASDIPLKKVETNFKIAEKRVALARDKHDRNLRIANKTNDPVLAGRPCAVPPPGTDVDLAKTMASLGNEVCPKQQKYGDEKFSLPTDVNSFDYELTHALGAGDHQLSIPSGLDPAVNPGGKVTVAGAPTQTKPKINGTLSSNFGVGQLAVFQLTGTYSPLSAYVVDGTKWIWDPTLAVDVGLRSTTSNNSITMASPFSRMFIYHEPPEAKTSGATNLPTYNRWANAPWYHLENVNLNVGPRIEMSQQFEQKNLLGNARLDFTFTRLEGTLAERRSMITKDLKAGDPNLGVLKGVNWGFKLVPYFSSDFGGHPLSETITNTKAKESVVVPPFGIFRIIAGFQSEIDYKSASLTTDESALDLISQEQVGVVTTTGVKFYRIGGIQPHSKVTLSYTVDPAKHYALSVIYEDGRQPPIFKYLNKVTVGITVTY